MKNNIGMRTLLVAVALLLIPSAAWGGSSALQKQLQSIVADRSIRGANIGVHVMNVNNNVEVFSHRSNVPLQPASTMKLITSAAALKILGPSYQFETKVSTSAKLLNNGVLKGDLYVQSNGDPTMVVEKMWKLVQDIRLAGVNEVEGKVIFDDMGMEQFEGIPGWEKQADIKRGPSYYPAIGAFTLNYNTTALVVRPSSKIGRKAHVVLETPSGVVKVRNLTKTARSGAALTLHIERVIEESSTLFKVSGAIPLNATAQRYYRAIADPTAYYMGTFKEMCEVHDIAVRGGFHAETIPEEPKRTLVVLHSPSLSKILFDMNKISHNLMAEQVVQALGVSTGNTNGSFEDGMREIDSYIESLVGPASTESFVNGSGLTHGTQVRAATITRVLADMHTDPEIGTEFKASLSIGGIDGTLGKRFEREHEVNQVRGKTGTLNGVSCLVGYVRDVDGQEYAFAFLINNLAGGSYAAKMIQDRFTEALMNNSSKASASLSVSFDTIVSK